MGCRGEEDGEDGADCADDALDPDIVRSEDNGKVVNSTDIPNVNKTQVERANE